MGVQWTWLFGGDGRWGLGEKP